MTKDLFVPRCLTAQHVNIDFCDFRPASVLQRVVDLETVGKARSHCRVERLVGRRKIVGVAVVLHEHDFPVGEVYVGYVPEGSGKIVFGVVVSDLEKTPGEQRRIDH